MPAAIGPSDKEKIMALVVAQRLIDLLGDRLPLRALTPQERVNRYVSRMPIAVVGHPDDALGSAWPDSTDGD